LSLRVESFLRRTAGPPSFRRPRRCFGASWASPRSCPSVRKGNPRCVKRVGRRSPMTPLATVYDVLDDWAGERFTLPIAHQLADMPLRQLIEFQAHYQDWQPKLRAKRLSPGELRPLVWNQFQAVGVFASGMKYPPNRDQFIRLLLTYAHGVAVPSELQAVFFRLSNASMSESLRLSLKGGARRLCVPARTQ